MKKNYVIVGLVIVAIGLIMLLAGVGSSNTNGPSTVAQAKARGKNTPPACLTANALVKPSDTDKSNIELAAASQLTDVPAGTNTAVNLATYDGSTATGAELYPNNYGSYNFTAKKISGVAANQLDWKITSFVACRP